MKTTRVISNSRGCVIELIHRDADPGMWVVRHMARRLLIPKRISSTWFNDEEQALAFADELKKDCLARHGA